MNMAPYGHELDDLQRDGMPYEDEPETGSCWNCGHAVMVMLGGKCYDLCVRERDEHNGGECGDVYECPDVRDCEHWCA